MRHANKTITSLLLAAFVVALNGCSETGPVLKHSVDGSAGAAGHDAPVDAADQDAVSGACPAQLPTSIGSGPPCTGTTICEYGQATCCGISSSAYTCKCQDGTFWCSMTVECNFFCPEAGTDGTSGAGGAGGNGDGGVQTVHNEGQSCDDGLGCTPGLVCKAIGDPCPTYPNCNICYLPCGTDGGCPSNYRTCFPPSGQGGNVCLK
jgi:hypothetical protein